VNVQTEGGKLRRKEKRKHQTERKLKERTNEEKVAQKETEIQKKRQKETKRCEVYRARDRN
jgi:hypothetical protein